MASSELILFEVPTIQIRLTGKKVSNARGNLTTRIKRNYESREKKP